MGIGGLFLAPLWTLLRHSFPGLLLGIPPANASDAASAVGLSKRIVASVVDGMGWVVWAGRLLSLGIECYFVWGLASYMLYECEEEEGEGEKKAVNGGGKKKAS